MLEIYVCFVTLTFLRVLLLGDLWAFYYLKIYLHFAIWRFMTWRFRHILLLEDFLIGDLCAMFGRDLCADILFFCKV